jgi:beta-N-acetylhexosaminidase
MERAMTRRRRAALAILLAASAGALVLGVAFGAGPGHRSEPRETLPARQLVGERIVTGFEGAVVPPRLRAAIHAGRIAGVILFADNLPGRAADRRLIARLQGIPRPPTLARAPLLVMVDQEGAR